jgi:hypothetical protein
MNAQQALGWALLHFLWQGLAVGLLTWVVLRVLVRPEWRYVTSAAAMTAMALSPVFTFLVLWRDRLVLDIPLPSTVGAGAASAASGQPMDWLLWMTRAWLLGAVVLCARSAGGWYLARRRCRQGRGELWGLRGGVPVYESASVTVPQVFGWLRPIILLPFSAAAGLTPEQLEAVIEHELAHVRRHDYLVNLLQTIVESLLFYHPAVWWVSREMRRERELCCDEAAVARCGSRLLYSEALLLLEESRVDFAMAATGVGLQERIGRLLGMEERKTELAPLLLISGALVICGATLWGQQPAPAAAAVKPAPLVAPVQPPTPAAAPRPPAKPMRAAKPAPPPPRALDDDDLMGLDERSQASREQLQRAEIEWQAAMQRRMEHDERLAELQNQAHREMALADQQARSSKDRSIAITEIERRIVWIEGVYGKGALATDRGKVYLKLGPPDEIESHPGVKESWRYGQGPTFEFDSAGKLTKKSDSI